MYSYESALLCAWDPITAANSPLEGCRDIEPLPAPVEKIVRVFINEIFYDDLLQSEVEDYGLEESVDSFRRLKPGDILTWVSGIRVKGGKRQIGYVEAVRLPYTYYPATETKPAYMVVFDKNQHQRSAGWALSMQIDRWQNCVCDLFARKDYTLPDWSDCPGWIS